MGRGGAPLVPRYWGDTRHFFLLILYNFKNIGGGGGGGARAPPVPPTPRSLLLRVVGGFWPTMLRPFTWA